jgi:hypothetical protein
VIGITETLIATTVIELACFVAIIAQPGLGDPRSSCCPTWSCVIRDRLLALLSGEFVSRLGSQFTSLALPWFVLVTTGRQEDEPGVAGRVGADRAARHPVGRARRALRPEIRMVMCDAVRAPIVALVRSCMPSAISLG